MSKSILNSNIGCLLKKHLINHKVKGMKGNGKIGIPWASSHFVKAIIRTKCKLKAIFLLACRGQKCSMNRS